MIAVMMKPLGLFGAGEMARAIRPATKPMMMIHRMLMAGSGRVGLRTNAWPAPQFGQARLFRRSFFANQPGRASLREGNAARRRLARRHALWVCSTRYSAT